MQAWEFVRIMSLMASAAPVTQPVWVLVASYENTAGIPRPLASVRA